MNQRHSQIIGLIFIAIGVSYFADWASSSMLMDIITGSSHNWELMDILLDITNTMFFLRPALFLLAGISLIIKHFKLELPTRLSGLFMVITAACFLAYYPLNNLLDALSIPELHYNPWSEITLICASTLVVLTGVAWLASRTLGYKRIAGIMLIVAGAILLTHALDNFFSIIQYLTYGLIGDVFFAIQNSAFIAAGVVCLLPATRIREQNPS